MRRHVIEREGEKKIEKERQRQRDRERKRERNEGGETMFMYNDGEVVFSSVEMMVVTARRIMMVGVVVVNCTRGNREVAKRSRPRH